MSEELGIASMMNNGRQNTESNLMLSEPTCLICNGTGYTIQTIDGIDYAEQCVCLKNRVKENRIKFANIPRAFKEYRLNSFVANYYRDKAALKELVDTIKYWMGHLDLAKEKGIGLYLYSNTKGAGKTRMVTSIANELIHEHDMTVKFVTSLDILTEIRAIWDKDTEFRSEGHLLDYLNTTEVLIIDDFGTEVHKDWIDDRFYQIINTRYINKLITLFTSNYAIKELKYDDRIINRIQEMTYEIHFPEESVREYIATIRQEKLREEITQSGGTK